MTPALPVWAEREAAILAPYAMHAIDSVGRRHHEPFHAYRAPFERDRDRIVHSAAYRRLSFKTQVFTGEQGDYHRTRLTHTLEVASISRTLGRALRLNEDLVEALALAHDLGHPPFGHSGEDVLDECLRGEGGFSHNRQGLRIVEELETRYPEFPGLNLSIEVLDAQRTRAERHLKLRPLMEARVVEAADSVAYDTHDADDAMHLGLLRLDELLEIPLWREAGRRVAARYTNLSGDTLRRALLRELIDWQVSDLVGRAVIQIETQQIDSVEAAKNAEQLISASPDVAAQKIELERFLFNRVYRHPKVLEIRTEAQEKLRAMFARFVERPDLMPLGFQARVATAGLPRSVGDYLAGMTDRYALQEHRRIFSS